MSFIKLWIESGTIHGLNEVRGIREEIKLQYLNGIQLEVASAPYIYFWIFLDLIICIKNTFIIFPFIYFLSHINAFIIQPFHLKTDICSFFILINSN